MTEKQYRKMIYKFDKETDDLVGKMLLKNLECFDYRKYNFLVLKYNTLYLRINYSFSGDSESYRTNFSNFIFVEDRRKYTNFGLNDMILYLDEDYGKTLFIKSEVKISLKNINRIEEVAKNILNKEYHPDHILNLLEQ